MNSETVTQRIWQHSKATGVSKLILLALAQHADADGFCWPGYEALGEMVGLTKRNAMRNLAPPIESGEVMVWEQQGQHGGRGYTNIYLITVGLTSDQIQEIVKRRFELQADEVDTVLNKKGDEYITLCYLKRVSIETLLRTRDTKKGDKIDTLNGRMGDSLDTLNQQDPQKGDKIDTRTLESLNPESLKEREESRALPPFDKAQDVLDDRQELARQLTETCGYDATVLSNGTRQKLEYALDVLQRKKATPELVKKFGEEYWWGKSPPKPDQLTEEWHRFLQSKKKPKESKTKVSAF